MSFNHLFHILLIFWMLDQKRRVPVDIVMEILTTDSKC